MYTAKVLYTLRTFSDSQYSFIYVLTRKKQQLLSVAVKYCNGTFENYFLNTNPIDSTYLLCNFVFNFGFVLNLIFAFCFNF